MLGQRAIADLTVAPAVALHLRVQVPAGTPAADTVFIAASAPHLGTWDADGRPLKRGGDGVWELSVPIEAGVPLDYKITRGSWETVEKQADGSEQPNRSLTLDAEETVEFTVARWADSP